jgi:hypothetical protein
VVCVKLTIYKAAYGGRSSRHAWLDVVGACAAGLGDAWGLSAMVEPCSV